MRFIWTTDGEAEGLLRYLSWIWSDRYIGSLGRWVGSCDRGKVLCVRVCVYVPQLLVDCRSSRGEGGGEVVHGWWWWCVIRQSAPWLPGVVCGTPV